ncbi:response regulator transcription factor [Algoriphagus sediminis]|uniref:Response regulator transcription factor n=1 Tax=Algoriphagus sediminis TaxID=3057113 RepID=A0ABT7YCQ2_9BACT|nr:response regulator transcription factor [Algoriphagus sediminis]MDN3204288.1 response regulator transcription factor [Algoriphagus sediminis]
MIRIAIADDHTLFAKGLQGLIEEYEDFHVLGLFPDGQELVDFLKTNDVDVVLTDLNMPVLDGFGVIEVLKKKKLGPKVVVLSMYDDEKMFKECVKKGADAFLLKDSDPDEVVFTIHEVFEGRHVLDYKRVLKQANPESFFDAFREKYKLSKRESEIIHLIKEGNMNKEIAAMLSLSIQTVETHRKNIHQKLQVNSRIELINKIHEMNI